MDGVVLAGMADLARLETILPDILFEEEFNRGHGAVACSPAHDTKQQVDLKSGAREVVE
jgi:hypothetical protein